MSKDGRMHALHQELKNNNPALDNNDSLILIIPSSLLWQVFRFSRFTITYKYVWQLIADEQQK